MTPPLLLYIAIGTLLWFLSTRGDGGHIAERYRSGAVGIVWVLSVTMLCIMLWPVLIYLVIRRIAAQ